MSSGRASAVPAEQTSKVPNGTLARRWALCGIHEGEATVSGTLKGVMAGVILSEIERT